jgi:threonine dehydratase
MPTAAPPLVTLDAIRAAAGVLAGVAVRTPLLPSDALADAAGVPVWVKPEMLQRGGAFKLRGAYWYLATLSPAARAAGVVAPSSGCSASRPPSSCRPP